MSFHLPDNLGRALLSRVQKQIRPTHTVVRVRLSSFSRRLLVEVGAALVRAGLVPKMVDQLSFTHTAAGRETAAVSRQKDGSITTVTQQDIVRIPFHVVVGQSSGRIMRDIPSGTIEMSTEKTVVSSNGDIPIVDVEFRSGARFDSPGAGVVYSVNVCTPHKCNWTDMETAVKNHRLQRHEVVVEAFIDAGPRREGDVESFLFKAVNCLHLAQQLYNPQLKVSFDS
jgi:hypothetical protein